MQTFFVFKTLYKLGKLSGDLQLGAHFSLMAPGLPLNLINLGVKKCFVQAVGYQKVQSDLITSWRMVLS